MAFTNITGVSLPLAVWLAADDYDFSPGTQKAISVTSLMKPVRQILLRERLTDVTAEVPDIADRIPSRLGHSIHDGIERAWKTQYASAMRSLGYPEKIIQRVVINPETPPDADAIPIYLEKRSYKEFMGYKITGKFDMVLNGEVHDIKSTSVYAKILGDKDDQYRLQGSLYRWLNPELITEDHMFIQFVFTDWSRAMARQQQNNYPQQRIMPHRIELMSLKETEAWVTRRIKELEAHADLAEPDLPYCSDEDLWREQTKWKYFADPAKTDGKSTKNFDNEASANAFKASRGRGVVIEFPGKVKACGYCAAFPICTQKDLYEHG